jgi:hypothetical protein
VLQAHSGTLLHYEKELQIHIGYYTTDVTAGEGHGQGGRKEKGKEGKGEN